MTWIKVMQESALAPDRLKFIYPKGIGIILIRKSGKIYALRNMCAHLGCPFTGAKLQDFVLTCPCHDWRYDIRTGKFLDAPEISLQTYNTKTEGPDICVELTEEN
jgi:nitrite reductase/ring-hydroxylating ferredoxin subunit